MVKKQFTPPPPPQRSVLTKMLVLATLITIATTLSNLYTITKLSTWSIEERSQWNLNVGLLSASTTCMIIILFCYSLYSKRTQHIQIDFAYRFLLTLVILGSLLAVITEIPLWIYFIPTASGRYCFEIFFWILFLMVSRKTSNPFLFFMFGRIAIISGLLAGVLLRKFLIFTIDPLVNDQNLFIILSVVIVAIMEIAYVFVFSDHALLGVMREQGDESENQRTLDIGLEKIANQYGLSKRETQVFILLSKGRDGPYIQEHLHLSRGTISTHKQRIYQKLKINRVQELIDLVHHRDSQ
jgi:DNA-binding CsgD family transcriptional regulator